MEILPLYRDKTTGLITEASSSDILGMVTPIGENVEVATLFNDAIVNTCFVIVNNTAQAVYASNSTSSIYRNKPWVDGVVLEAGRNGDTVRVAMTHGKVYDTPTAFPTGTELYLGVNGILTTVAPTAIEGAQYKVVVGRYVTPNKFVFDPQSPVAIGSIQQETYTLRMDFISEDLVYKGEAIAGSLDSEASWRIQKIMVTLSGDTTVLWADGNTNFDNIWDNRLILTYS